MAEELRLKGGIEVDVASGGKLTKCNFIIVRNGCRILIGRDVMNVFGYKLVETHNVSIDQRLKAILDKHQGLFDGKLGKYKYSAVEI